MAFVNLTQPLPTFFSGRHGSEVEAHGIGMSGTAGVRGNGDAGAMQQHLSLALDGQLEAFGPNLEAFRVIRDVLSDQAVRASVVSSGARVVAVAAAAADVLKQEKTRSVATRKTQMKCCTVRRGSRTVASMHHVLSSLGDMFRVPRTWMVFMGAADVGKEVISDS